MLTKYYQNISRNALLLKQYCYIYSSKLNSKDLLLDMLCYVYSFLKRLKRFLYEILLKYFFLLSSFFPKILGKLTFIFFLAVLEKLSTVNETSIHV